MSASLKNSQDAKTSTPSTTRTSATTSISTPKIRQPVPSFHRSNATPNSTVRKFHKLSAPHVDSFNYFLDVGLSRAIADIVPYEIDVVDGSSETNRGVGHVVGKEADTIMFWLENVKVGMPTKTAPSSAGGSGGVSRLYPRECRELSLVYSAPITAEFCLQLLRRDGFGAATPMGSVMRIPRNFGMMPIMVMSKACHLHGKSPWELVRLREEQTEFGGYFIVGGIERCIRLLQVPRANHPTAIRRSNYKNRGRLYTDLGVAVRCQRHNGDMSTITNTLHYLTTGGATLKFVARKQEFLLPVVLVLRALSGGEGVSSIGAPASEASSSGSSESVKWKESHGITDEELYDRIVQGDENNTFVRARAELLLQEARQYHGMQTPAECLAFIGSRFRLMSMKANSTTDVQIGHYIINRCVRMRVRILSFYVRCDVVELFACGHSVILGTVDVSRGIFYFFFLICGWTRWL